MSLTEEDKRWIDERLEGMETRLLTAFHKWASPAEIRQRGQTAVVQALELDMIDVKERLEKLEKKQ